MVAAAAIALGREAVSARRIGALVIASTGLALVVAGAGAGELEPVGAALGLVTAVVYSTYILVSERVRRPRGSHRPGRARLPRSRRDADRRLVGRRPVPPGRRGIRGLDLPGMYRGRVDRRVDLAVLR